MAQTVPPVADVGLLVAWPILVAWALVRYRRGETSRQRTLLVVALGLTWTAYALMQVTDGEPVAVEGPLQYVVGVASFGLLLAGLFVGYRWWTRYYRPGADVQAG